MKKRIITFLLSIGVICLVAIPSSYATLVSVGDTVSFSNGTSGGRFSVTVNGNADVFDTFCLEMDEFVSFGPQYTVSDISNAAIAGGVGGDPTNGDPLDAETIYLYHHFFNGSLSGYNGTEENINNLQNAIWFFEQEITAYIPGATDYVTLAETWVTNNPGVVYHDVAAMNIQITDTDGTMIESQSMLVHVPEPGTMLMLGTALFVMAGFGARRFRKK